MRKFIPLFNKVLVKRKTEGADKTKGGLFIPDAAQETPSEGVVVAVGNDVEAVKKDDHVLFGKYTGTEIKIDDEEFLIMTDKEIVGIFKGN